MSLLPILADLRRLRRVSNVREMAMLNGFGSLATRIEEEAVGTALLEGVKQASEEWNTLVARELLLAQSWGHSVSDALWVAFGEAAPFQDGPPLRALRGRRMAAAAFPVELPELSGAGVQGRSEPHPWWMLWLCEKEEGGEDHSARIQEWKKGPEEAQDCSPFLVASHSAYEATDIAQQSWTLAAELARRAMAASAAPSLRQQLAGGWMISGQVLADGTVAPVTVGNKVRIKTARRWMFPPENRREVLGFAASLNTVRFVSSVDSAWATLCNHGVTDGGERRWSDEKVAVLHSFTSAAWAPVVQALLLAAPVEFKLWHSSDEDSQAKAFGLEKTLKPGAWTDAPPRMPQPREISSSSLGTAERQIRAELERDLAAGRLVLFNITQGNRLMGLAPYSLAQLHPNLWLIYKDRDAARHEFTVIRYEGVLPTTHKLVGSTKMADLVPTSVWDALEGRSPQDDMVKTLGGREIGKKICFPTEMPSPAPF